MSARRLLAGYQSFGRLPVACLLASCLAVAGCKGKPDSGEKAPASAGQPTPPNSPASTGERNATGASTATDQPATAPADKAAKRARERAALRAQVSEQARQLLASWTVAQKERDQAAYLALYDQKHFKGVRRTHDGKVKTFDFAGWKADRSKMFRLDNMEIATEALELETWLDRESQLKKGVIVLHFTQRWRGGKYADHGTKSLHLWRDDKGQLAIIYEDMLNSEPGWDRQPEAAVAEVAWPAPASHEEAMKRWRELAITGADYHDKLASIPADTPLSRALAAALVREGGFTCPGTVDSGMCGIEEIEFAPLAGPETFEDPCVRRRLLPWALAQLDGPQIFELEPQLLAIAALPEPETEAISAVLGAMHVASVDISGIADPDQADAADAQFTKAQNDLLVRAYTHIDHQRIPEDSLDDISSMEEATLVRLYREAHLEYAVAQLAETLDDESVPGTPLPADADEYDRNERAKAELVYRTVVDAVADRKLSPHTRAALIAALPANRVPAKAGPKGTDPAERTRYIAGLVSALDTEHCGLLTAAVETLVALGETEHLPRRPGKAATSREYGALICLLMSAEMDSLDNDQVFLSLLPEKGKVAITHTVHDLDYEMYNEPDDPDFDPEGDTQTETDHMTRTDGGIDHLQDFSEFADAVPECGRIRGDSFSCTTDVDRAGVMGRDDGAGLAVREVTLHGGDHVSLTFQRFPDGLFYLVEIERYQENGCPC